MEREATIDRSRAIELAKKKSETLMTQETYDRLQSELIRITEQVMQLRQSRIPDSDRDIFDANKRTRDLEDILKHNRIISPRQQTDVVRIGNTISVRHVELNLTEDLHMVGDFDQGMEGAIHLGTPVADAIYGREAGETVAFVAGSPKTRYTLEIQKILPGKFDPPRDPSQRKSS